jgi:DNA-binding transcriptional ArsR family regulator
MKMQYLHELPEAMLPAARVFSALGDPARQRILLLFEPEEALSIKDIAALFSLSRTAVVHHLNVLERAGILCRKRSGKAALYAVCPGVVLEALNSLRRYILEAFPDVRESGAP